MSYTTTDLVKKHVIAPPSQSSNAVTLTAQPTGAVWTPLSAGALQKGSVLVVALTQNKPQSESLTFASSQAQSALLPIAQDSVTIASDSSLGTIYVENVDYIVDYQTGEFSAVSGGALAGNATTQLWYFPLTTYVEGADYEIDYELGRIRRLTAGAIISSQGLQVTFTSVTQALDESVYAEAVSEANQLVSVAVDPDEDFGADLILQAAATYLAASIVCRVAGTLALASAADKKSASVWLELAASFRTDGASALDRFRPPRKRLKPPQSV